MERGLPARKTQDNPSLMQDLIEQMDDAGGRSDKKN